MKLIEQATKLLEQGHCEQRRLCGMQRNVPVVANVAGAPFFLATIADVNGQHFQGLGKMPVTAIESAICYEKISKQGWG